MNRWTVAWAGTAILFLTLYAGVPLAGLAIDHALNIPALPLPIRIVGPFLIVAGAAGLTWCFLLFARAGGTPNPILPPRELVTGGPYRWTRNPIAGSHFLAVLGLAIAVGSVGAVFLTLLLGIPADFLTRREERVLESKFGKAYRLYRAAVPRWIPRPPKH